MGFSAWCEKHSIPLNFVQNVALLAAIVSGLGSGASFMAAHVDLQNLQATTEGMLESLRGEIVIATQTTTSVAQPVFVLPGGQAPDASQAVPADPSVERARGHLHNATAHWARREYGPMRENLTAGYQDLGADVPLPLARSDLLAGEVQCVRFARNPKDIDPIHRVDCLLEVPSQAYDLGVLSIGAGIVSALFAAVSPPTVRVKAPAAPPATPPTP